MSMSRGKRKPKTAPAAAAGDSGLRGPGRDHVSADGMRSALEGTIGYQRITGQGLTAEELADRKAADVTAALKRLTDDQINQAIVQAGGKARKPRTLRRWKQYGALPADITTAPTDANGKVGHSAEELINRHAIIAELGGTQAAAQKLGRHPRSVEKWQSGQTNSFIKGAKATMRKEQIISDGVRHATAPPPRAKPGQGKRRAPAKHGQRAGAKSHGTPADAQKAMPRPKITIWGRIDYEGDGVEYERSSDKLDISTVDWPDADVADLILAFEAGNTDEVVALCERAATERWANRSQESNYQHYYDDNNGFRIKRVDDMDMYFDKG